MAIILSMIVAGLIGIITTSFGYGWIKDNKLFISGAALNLILVILEVTIIIIAVDNFKSK